MVYMHIILKKAYGNKITIKAKHYLKAKGKIHCRPGEVTYVIDIQAKMHALWCTGV